MHGKMVFSRNVCSIRVKAINNLFYHLSANIGPCDLRPLHLTIPFILRLLIIDTTLIFSVYPSICKTTSNLRPYFPG